MIDKRFKVSLNDIEGIIREVLDSGGEFSFIINGTSMRPLLKEERDSVALVARTPEIGDVLLYKRDNGTFVLHRIIGEDEEGFIMCGDNQFLKEHGIKDENIIGLVAYFVRKGKKLTTDSPKYKLYIKALPLLRFFKMIKNRIGRVVKNGK